MATAQQSAVDWQVTPAKVQEAVSLLVKAAHPRKIIMFGSRARGAGRPESDVDLMVITRPLSKERRWQETVRLREVLDRVHMTIDLLVVPEDELAYWGDTPGHVYYEARLDGTVLYEEIT